MTMHFRSIKDLYGDVWRNLHRVPADIDLVVAIPRSGLLPATMIALARNLPIADIEGFAAGRTLATGHTRQDGSFSGLRDFQHVLVMDDSTRTGASMREAREKLAGLAAGGVRMTFAVAYGTGAHCPDVDLVLANVPEPRVFEWNVLHHPIVSQSCFDIDGVLCIDPAPHQNDDGDAYLDFLLTAAPLHRPRREIAMLVTSRLEKYRPQTEDWLARHGIRYRELRMLDLPDAESRRRLGVHGSFKAEVYRQSPCTLFVESEVLQAREIARLSGKPALSLQGPEMCNPGMLNPRAATVRLHPARLQKRIRRILARLRPSAA
ncbi:MAG: hypothetical protein RLZZ08_126 [Pseudomonadota bacterium]|jgi:hypoxanthine phosphoribosyltransferase